MASPLNEDTPTILSAILRMLSSAMMIYVCRPRWLVSLDGCKFCTLGAFRVQIFQISIQSRPFMRCVARPRRESVALSGQCLISFFLS